MEEGKKTRFKIFLWDQFILPFYLLLNLYQLQALLIALIILNSLIWQNILAFYVLVISLGIVFLYQIVKYYKSGEFMHNYRKYKSEKGEYGDYRKAIKTFKKEKERQEINIENVDGNVVAENIIKEGVKEENEQEKTI